MCELGILSFRLIIGRRPETKYTLLDCNAHTVQIVFNFRVSFVCQTVSLCDAHFRA